MSAPFATLSSILTIAQNGISVNLAAPNAGNATAWNETRAFVAKVGREMNGLRSMEGVCSESW